MSSDRARHAAALAVPFLLLLTGGCGKQGDPQPRPRNVPQATNDLKLRLRGDQVLLDFAYPATTVAGLPLAGLESVTVYEVVRPQTAEAALPVLTAADLEALAKPALELAGRDLSDAVVGDRLRLSLPLRPAAEGVIEAHVFAVRTKALHGGESPWSNPVAVRALPEVASPSELEVEAKKRGIALTWTPVAGADGSVVLRRSSSNPSWGDPLTTLDAGLDQYLDTSATYGERYVYTVVSVLGKEPPIESAPRAEREIDYRDVFAPDSPRELHAVVLGGEIRLVWENPADDDLAGVLIDRSIDGSEFQRISATPLDAAEYTDRDAPHGRRVAYRLVAVDRNGNASPASDAAEVRAP